MWTRTEAGTWQLSSRNTSKVGKFLLAHFPTGESLRPPGSPLPLPDTIDVTGLYKNPEGSLAERVTMHGLVAASRVTFSVAANGGATRRVGESLELELDASGIADGESIEVHLECHATPCARAVLQTRGAAATRRHAPPRAATRCLQPAAGRPCGRAPRPPTVRMAATELVCVGFARMWRPLARRLWTPLARASASPPPRVSSLVRAFDAEVRPRSADARVCPTCHVCTQTLVPTGRCL